MSTLCCQLSYTNWSNCLFYLRISDLPSVVWHQHDTCFVMSLYIFRIGFSSLCIIKVYYLSTNICGLDDSLCIYIISPSCSHYYLSNHYGTSQMIIDIFSFVKIMSSFLCLYQIRRVHSHIRGIDFTSFLDIDLGVCGCPDNVVFFVFILFLDCDLPSSMPTHRNANIRDKTGVVSWAGITFSSEYEVNLELSVSLDTLYESNTL